MALSPARFLAALLVGAQALAVAHAHTALARPGLATRSFQLQPRASTYVRSAPAPLMKADVPDEEGSTPSKGDTGVDWDSAWQVELQKRETGQAQWRPEGREPVPEDELLKARMQAKMDDASMTVMDWTRTWQFWVAIIATISVISAVSGIAGQDTSGTANSFTV